MSKPVSHANSTESALVVYNPKNATQSIFDKITSLFQESTQSALECEKYASKHLKTTGEGRIFILLGTSTAGKTSIMRQLMQEVPNSIGTSMDEYGPYHDANLIHQYAPEQYAKMALAMEHSDIAYAVFAGEHDSIRWKDNVPERIRLEAQEALSQAKKMIDSFPRVPFQEVESRMMNYIISESAKGKTVVFDIFDSNLFLTRMIEKNYYAPLKRGLAYCPFPILAERVMERNSKALGVDGNPEDWRPPLQPLMEFVQFHKPAEEGDTVIDTLNRQQVEKAFESAYQQEVEYWSKHASEDSRAFERYSMLTSEHDKLKNEIMTNLGFSHLGIKEVKITPKFKGFDYLFNTHVMKPNESTEIIRAWK